MRQALLPRRQWSWRTRLKRVRRRSVKKLRRGRRRPARRSRKQYLNLVAGIQVGQQGRSLKAALFAFTLALRRSLVFGHGGSTNTEPGAVTTGSVYEMFNF